ncbi:MAG: RHH-type transcriptional regulator, proline utilization regulon repressor / proline dehydrogenase, partial [Microbacteriaceae bacterium]|nr:RHH-type transcriptional regulator, proline utilization regulon repressor / proline dehydrogenase [Microbacteriaceae bacterium]
LRRGGTRRGAVQGGAVGLNVNLLGEAVLGEREAARRLAGTHDLLARDDVDYVSIKVSATVAPHSPWAFDADVSHVVERLTPLFERAAAASPAKFINLDMEEYKDLDLTIAVFTRILDEPRFAELQAGIVLQAYLPDALGAMIRLGDWAARRRAAGGAPIKVRLVKGANLPMERVESSLRGWPLATWPTKRETDTNYKRILNYALDPTRVDAVHLGIAGHNLFDVAFAWLLAGERGVRESIEFEMLLGMATGQAEAIRHDVGGLLLYTPVVKPQEFDVAIAYLIRRLEEGASEDNFMSAVFELAHNEALFERERQRFLASLTALDAEISQPQTPLLEIPLSRRTQDRRVPEVGPSDRFENTADTDPSLPANRDWGSAILSRVAESTLGQQTLSDAKIPDDAALEHVVQAALIGATGWGALSGEERADILHRVGDALSARRADLIETMTSETGKTIDQADPEVSEAIDFAHYYAELARQLDRVDGATFVPSRLTVVTPPWNFPVAIPAGSTLAALAAGSAVILKPAGPAGRCGAVLAEAVWAAGVPRDVLQLVQLDEAGLGQQLIAHPAVDRVILTGAYETAELFRSFRPDLPLLAETSGKNAIIVTPSADLDLAVKDVVASAFGHAGQKCSAASLVILVGSVARSARFANQLTDAVASLKVGYPSDPATQMGPIIEPASGKLLSALTTLGDGETWLLEPKRLDERGALWSPGLRTGVRRRSEFHLTEYFGPVLGIMTAATLDEAIALQNDPDFGLTAGIHSLDPEEIRRWIQGVQAGNLYVNRGITGAIVRRQPFGGWKRSAVGAGTKAGGPNYLIGLGEWAPAPLTADGSRIENPLVAAIAKAVPDEALIAAFRSDAATWKHSFGSVVDVSNLTAERNLFRYLPVPVTIRLSDGAAMTELLRVVGAGLLAGSELTVSSATEPPVQIPGVRPVVEDDRSWLARAATLDAGRIRLIGGNATALYAAIGGSPDVAVYAGSVTRSGRIELLPFLREQAISITAHRFGTPNHLTDTLI